MIICNHNIETPYVVGITVLLLAVGLTGNSVGRLDGVILWVFFILYLTYLYWLSKNGDEDAIEDVAELEKSDTLLKLIIMIVLGIVCVVFGSNITVDATMTKDASIDYTGKNRNRNGYDMVTTLASPFIFTKQTASISNYDSIEILDTNLGFDIETGITEVELDLNQEHYWMDIKKKTSEG